MAGGSLKERLACTSVVAAAAALAEAEAAVLIESELNAAAEGEEGGEAPHTPGPPPAEGKERELMELALAYELMSRVAMQEG